MTYAEIVKALATGTSLYWADPDPIPGNDYRITSIQELLPDDEMCLIEYGDGSEAEVFLHEIGKETPYDYT